MAASRYGPLALLLFLSAARAPASPSRVTPATTHAAPHRHALPTVLVVHVVDSASLAPLPNAEVTSAPIRRLTDTEGNARFTWPASGVLKLRVRELGFRYAETTVHRGHSPTATEDTVVVALQHAAFALPQMVTQAEVRCVGNQDSAAFAFSRSTMELLRFGAEQYDNFRATYPFHVALARRTVRSALPKAERVEETSEFAESETFGDPYQPGQVLLRIPKGYYVPTLFVSTLADSAFWNRHCFYAKGVESRDGRRVIRLDFEPSRGVKAVDWEGSAWIDSAASVLRRVDFRLANLRGRFGPRRFEGYTTFTVPSPYIAVPDSTIAWWWTESEPSPNDDKYTADVLQFLTMKRMEFRREPPPALRRN